MRLYYIYVITCSQNDRVYVGKTVNLKARWRGHKGDATRGDQRHLYRAIRLHGVPAFTMTPIIGTLSSSDARELETLVIKQFHVAGVSLFNHNMGGNGPPELPGIETCQKISARLREVWSDTTKREKLGTVVAAILAQPEVHAKLGKKGMDHGLAKLTDAEVLAMRSAYHDLGVGAPELGRQYGVCRNVAWRVVTGSLWKHLPMPTVRRKPRHPRSKT